MKIFTVLWILIVIVFYFVYPNNVEGDNYLAGRTIKIADSSSHGIYLLEFDNKQYIINSEGGIIEHKKD